GGERVPYRCLLPVARYAAAFLVRLPQAKPAVRIAQCRGDAKPAQRLLVVLGPGPTIGVTGGQKRGGGSGVLFGGAQQELCRARIVTRHAPSVVVHRAKLRQRLRQAMIG